MNLSKPRSANIGLICITDDFEVIFCRNASKLDSCYVYVYDKRNINNVSVEVYRFHTILFDENDLFNDMKKWAERHLNYQL